MAKRSFYLPVIYLTILLATTANSSRVTVPFGLNMPSSLPFIIPKLTTLSLSLPAQ